MSKALKTPPIPPPPKKQRGVDDLIKETWRLIDQAKHSLSDPNLSENDKIRWAGVLANAIGTLNKLLWKAGAGRMDEEDLATMLSKIPEKYAKIVKKRLPAVGEPSLNRLGRGDLVEVTWLDASVSHNITKLTNRAVATYKRTVGRFLAAKKDTHYGIEHIILITETTDEAAFDITSIPLPIVVAVKRLAKKEGRKRINGAASQWTAPLKHGGLKIITRKVRK